MGPTPQPLLQEKSDGHLHARHPDYRPDKQSGQHHRQSVLAWMQVGNFQRTYGQVNKIVRRHLVKPLCFNTNSELKQVKN